MKAIAGWQVGTAIVPELEVGLTVAHGGLRVELMPPEVATLHQMVSPAWQAEWPAFLGEQRGSLSILSTLAALAGVPLEADYSRATLAMRQLTLESALQAAQRAAQTVGIGPDAELPPEQQLPTLTAELLLALYTQGGLPPPSSELQRQLHAELQGLVPLLQGGSHHTRFWHWLDRFFYEWYTPWRATRAALMAHHQSRVVLALGGDVGETPLGDLSWLPPQNPLRAYPELWATLSAAGTRLFFWIEPFGLGDSWFLLPGVIGVAVAEPGALFQNFRSHAEQLAERLKAFSDPTRLIILRLIRNFSMDNTAMANYLELARPTVSIHARQLREAGLIETHQEGRQARHELRPDEIRRLFNDLARFLDLPLE